MSGRSHAKRTLWGVEVQMLPQQRPDSVAVWRRVPTAPPLPSTRTQSQPAAVAKSTPERPSPDVTATAATATELPTVGSPLHFDIIVTRGNDVVVPAEVAEAVLASLPDDQRRGSSSVKLLLVLWSGQLLSHQWLAHLRRRDSMAGGAASSSSWVIPAVEWSYDVLQTPGGYSLFPHDIGRLLVTVWCAPRD